MELIKKVMGCLVFLVLACGPVVSKDLKSEDFYIGLDGQMRQMKFNKDFGHLIMKKNHPQTNIYVGYKIKDNLWIEIGRESTVTKTKETCVYAGQRVNGVAIPASVSPALYRTKVRAKGPHIDLVFSKKIFDGYSTRALGSVGLSAVTISCQRVLLQAGIPPVYNHPTRDMKKKSISLRLMGGIQHNFRNGIGIRGYLSFVNTGRMDIKSKDSGVKKLPVIPKVLPKDSFIVGIGFVVPF